MNKKADFGISNMKDWNSLFTTYENVLGLVTLDKNSPRKEMLDRNTKSSLIGMIWIEKGTCTLLIENLSYTLRAGSFLLIPPSETLSLDDISPDFAANLLITEKTFMDECISNNQILSFYNCLFVKRLLQTELKLNEMAYLTENFNDLKNKIENNTHSFYHEMIGVQFKSFILDLTNILNNKEESKTFQQFTRKEEVFNKFMDLLLKNYKKQHEVAFYAEKLFITPQYLTMIIKSLTGKTTNKWIDDTLILEARKMLKTTQTPIQQIADYLNFSDQSTFGKFFKKYQGVSPVEYRRSQYYSPAMAV